MKFSIIRYKVKANKGEENEVEVKKLVAFLKKTKPEGIRSMTLKSSDGLNFTAIVQGDTTLMESEVFKKFQEGLYERLDGEPAHEELEVIEAYNFFA